MAATFTVTYPENGVVVAKWAGLANGEAGSNHGSARYRDRSIQITGTFGVGGTVVIEGSNDGINWVTLRDTNETPLSFIGADLAVILEPTLYIRPRVTAGDATTSLTVTLVGVNW